jgi:CheY-like chemotaxis protein
MATVLIVEDDDVIRATMRMVLEDEGYAVYEAHDGQPALTYLRTSPQPLVVLLDLNMPGLDGEGVLRAVARDASLTDRHAFVLVTAKHGRTLPLTFINLLSELHVPILAKPFDLDELLAAVRQAELRLS